MPNPDPVVAFLHIPKTAGVSIMRLLWMRYGVWPPHRLLRLRQVFGFPGEGHGLERLAKIASLPAEERQKVKVFQAHCGFGAQGYFDRPLFYFTFLREPITRAVSTLHYVLASDVNDVSGSTVEELVLNDQHPAYRFYLDNAQVRYLAGEDGAPYDGPKGSVTEQMLDTAIERLDNQMDCFGLTERMNESIALLGMRLGWRGNFVPELNRTKGGGGKRRDDLSPHLMQRVQELNELDVRLYEFAAKKFEAEVDALGDHFQQQVRRVASRSQRWGSVFGKLDTIRRSLKGRSTKR